jgi:hypothetical protein
MVAVDRRNESSLNVLKRQPPPSSHHLPVESCLTSPLSRLFVVFSSCPFWPSFYIPSFLSLHLVSKLNTFARGIPFPQFHLGIASPSLVPIVAGLQSAIRVGPLLTIGPLSSSIRFFLIVQLRRSLTNLLHHEGCYFFRSSVASGLGPSHLRCMFICL